LHIRSFKQEHQALIQFLDAKIHHSIYIVCGIVCLLPKQPWWTDFWTYVYMQHTASVLYVKPWTTAHGHSTQNYTI